MIDDITIESHPFEPFLPEGARLLMLGTFPPSQKRWCMPFYYPNYQNDMWRIFGICFYGDKRHFLIEEEKRFNLEKIKPFLLEKGIAMYDTAVKVRRLKNTASDKDLDIVEPTDLVAMLRSLTRCEYVITAGQLATVVFCQSFGVKEPKVGGYVEFRLGDGLRIGDKRLSETEASRRIRLYRMPSSSRAYPMSPEKKAEYYQEVFRLL